MSTYEVHLGSWRPGLSLSRAGRRADRLRRRAGLHPRRAAAGRRAPVRRLVGLSGHVVLRADVAVRHSRRFPRTWSTALHQAGIGVIVDWVPAHFPKDAWALGRFDGTAALRALRPPPRRATRLGHIRFRLRPRRGAQLPGGQRAVLAAGVSTSTGCGWTPSRRCSTWTTRGPADGWTPNIYGGRENLEAVQFLQEMNATVHKVAPGIVTIAEESTVVARRHPADKPWRTWLLDEVEHGLDERHAGLHQP